MADQRLAALLQLPVRWVPDPTAPGLFQSESGSPTFRLRPTAAPVATQYTLLADGHPVRQLDELPAGWTVEPDYDAVAVAIEGLRHHRSEVRQTASWRLSALADRRALPALERTSLADRGQVTVERGFVDDYEPIFPDAVDALRSLRPARPHRRRPGPPDGALPPPEAAGQPVSAPTAKPADALSRPERLLVPVLYCCRADRRGSSARLDQDRLADECGRRPEGEDSTGRGDPGQATAEGEPRGGARDVHGDAARAGADHVG